MSNPNDPVFYFPTSAVCVGWYFWDETWTELIGPYPCEWMARGELLRYCRVFLGDDR